jgi:hypothetical protein
MHNIDPKIWGPPTWDFLHYVTLSYPDYPTQEEKDNIKVFFMLVGKVLPCQNCRNNFYKHINIHKLTDEVVSNRYNLVMWLIKIHNEVNKMHGKPLLTYEKVIKKYLSKPESCIKLNISTNTIYISLLVLLIILTISIIKFYK